MTAVAFGIAFPAVFFVLAAAHAIEEHAAFTMAKWSGVGLLGFYGFGAARLAGDSLPASALRALGAALIGAFLVALKALLHRSSSGSGDAPSPAGRERRRVDLSAIRGE